MMVLVVVVVGRGGEKGMMMVAGQNANRVPHKLSIHIISVIIMSLFLICYPYRSKG